MTQSRFMTLFGWQTIWGLSQGSNIPYLWQALRREFNCHVWIVSRVHKDTFYIFYCTVSAMDLLSQGNCYSVSLSDSR
jgi:hypothetical protein